MSLPSLQSLFAELQAERERTWTPEQLKLNADQRRELVEASDPATWPALGSRFPDFTLETPDGRPLTLNSLIADGPAVLVFFRFATCPACNIALPHYDQALAAPLRDLGATLVAVSPQIPERLGEIRTRHTLNFEVATDRDNALGRELGILFTPNAASRATGSFIGDTTGTGTWELPQPAVFVIAQDRSLRFADVSPDWLARTEAEPVLAAVRDLAPVVAG